MKYLSREDVIVLIIFAMVGLIVPAVVASRHFFGMDPLSLFSIHWGRAVFGAVFTVLATVVCLWNFYVSLFVPWLYNRQHGSMADFANPSGLPMIGGFFILCAGALMPPSVLLGIFLFLLYFMDGNGIPWFFIFFVQKGI